MNTIVNYKECANSFLENEVICHGCHYDSRCGISGKFIKYRRIQFAAYDNKTYIPTFIELMKIGDAVAYIKEGNE